jgi:hypothetical protein
MSGESAQISLDFNQCRPRDAYSLKTGLDGDDLRVPLEPVNSTLFGRLARSWQAARC